MDSTKLNLSNRIVYLLFGYYFAVFICGTIAAIIFMLPNLIEAESITYFSRAIFASIGISLTGSSIYYIRKLYKSCINEEIEDKADKILSKLGSAIYYFARPLFSVGFALIIVIAIKSGHALVSTSNDLDSEAFLYTCMFFAFFSGFAAGRFIKYLEGRAESILKIGE